METTVANLPTLRGNTNMESSLRSLQAERTALAAVSGEQHLDVTLVTDEGDKVTISLDARAAALYGSYEEASADGQGFAAAKGEFSAGLYEREMTFTVEGDLSEKEQKDIRKALKTLDRMMHNFVNGDVKPMLAKMGKLQGLESLAGIEANMSYERTVIVARQSQAAATYAPETASTPAVSQTPVHSDDGAAVLAQKADEMADRMAREIAAAQTPADRMLAFVEQLMDDYRKQMAAQDPMGSRLIDRMTGQLHDVLAQFNSQSQSAALPTA